MNQTRIQGNLSPAGLLLSRGPQLPHWSVGQVVTAKVMAVDPGGEVTLRLFNQTLRVHSEVPLKTGDELKLLVKQVESDILLELAPVRSKPTPSGPVNDALRQNLPQQRPYQPLINHLLQLAEGKQLTQLLKALEAVDWPRLTPAAGSTTTPAAATQRALADSDVPVAEQLQRLGKLVRQMAQAVPQSRELGTPLGLRQAVAQSGLWMEAKIALPNSPAPSLDLKANLLRLNQLIPQLLERLPLPRSQAMQSLSPAQQQAVTQLRNLLVTLLSEAEGALARLKLVQAQNSPGASTTPDTQWVLEIPIRHADQAEVIQLQIRRDKEQSPQKEEQESWSINLAFENPQHGPFHIMVHLLGNTISANIYAEREATAERFRLQLGDLQQRLEAIGLDTGQLGSRVGRLPAIVEFGKSMASLIDTSA